MPRLLWAPRPVGSSASAAWNSPRLRRRLMPRAERCRGRSGVLVVRRRARPPAAGSHALLRAARADSALAEVPMRHRGTRLGRERGAELRDAPRRVCPRRRARCRGCCGRAPEPGIDGKRDPEMRGRFLGLVLVEQRVGQVVVRVGIVRLHRERALVAGDGFVELALRPAARRPGCCRPARSRARTRAAAR